MTSLLARLIGWFSGSGTVWLYAGTAVGIMILGGSLYIQTLRLDNARQTIEHVREQVELCETNQRIERLMHEQKTKYIEEQCGGLRNYYETLPPPPGGSRTYLPKEENR